VSFTERFVHTGDVAVNVAEWPTPSPGAPVLVLVHGYGANWHTWGRVVDGLSTEFHLFAIDLRGMGRSGRFGMGSVRQTWADDVASVVATLGDRPVTLIGHSLGGWVAAAVAAQRPELVSRAVLVEPFSGTSSQVHIRERGRRQEQRARRAELIRSARVPEDLVPAVREQYADAADGSIERIAKMWFEMDPALEVWMSRRSKDEGTFDHIFGGIQCPTLIVQGAVDRGGIVPDEESDRLNGLIPDCRVLRWPRVGHSPHIARNHDFIRAVKRFHGE
jgi:pimeloyl-ACP methyl ester carboxylesterase